MMRRLYSWWMGFRIGEIRYERKSPFVTGDIGCMLPRELWGEKEKRSLRFHYHVVQWDGFRWNYIGDRCVEAKDAKSGGTV